MFKATSIRLIARAVLTLGFAIGGLVASPVGFAQTPVEGQGKVKIEWLGHEFYRLTSPKGVVVITSPWLANPDGPVPLDSLARTDFILVPNAHNDDMAIGAIQAIEEAGMKPGTDITIISIDGVKGAFEAMIAGKLNVSVECSPLLGPQLMQAVKDLKAGKTLPKRIVTQEGVFPMEVAAKEFPNRKY
jgi:hypothetical protein